MSLADRPGKSVALYEALLSELHRHIVGLDHLLERLVIAIIADGHVLLEGVPGLAKTRCLAALAACVDVRMQRIQFTPDLLPSDLIGTEVFSPQTGEFSIRKGPIFTNIVLADEINRAPPKVQSALLQAMQEREVTIGEETFTLPDPFLVLATQNPIEQEGTYPLPEAQSDRFLMKLKVSYPNAEDELRIVNMVTNSNEPPSALQPVLHPSDIADLRRAALKVFVDPKIDQYVVALVQATRNTDSFGLVGLVDWGASPRASIALKTCARALALVRGKTYVTPDDIRELAPAVLRHRILPSFEAEARGVDSDQIVAALLRQVTSP